MIFVDFYPNIDDLWTLAFFASFILKKNPQFEKVKLHGALVDGARIFFETETPMCPICYRLALQGWKYELANNLVLILW